MNDKLDLGAGLDIVYANATLNNALPNLSPLLPDGRSDLRGEGVDFGYVLGAQYHATPRFTVGLSYRSAVDHALDGRVRVVALQGTPAAQTIDTSGTATFSTPWIATIAARWGITDKLTLNAQVQRIGWSEFDAINVTYAGQTQSTPQGYVDTTTGAFGLDYAVNTRFTVRAGVQVDQTPTPDNNRTTRVPDGDRYLVGGGATVKATERLSFDVSGAYIHFDDSRVNSSFTAYAGTPVATPISLQGLVSGYGVILSAGAHYRF